ncbi:MAG TPA: MOSC domain-containing protein [Candidatus Limnocylindria bacterium]|nr:MOSC domain-containing protein [Candidatus Limnocylindria bacterium]
MSRRLVSVNVGRPRPVERLGTLRRSAIWKEPVAGRVAVRGVNVEGDDQGDRRVHGGPDQAVYAYAREDYEWWERELGQALAPGTFGENLTTEGVDVSGAAAGERWRVGSAVLEVTKPRLPCWKLGMRMGDEAFIDRFAQAARFGAYLRIVREGEVGAGDEIVVERSGAGATVRDVGVAKWRRSA